LARECADHGREALGCPALGGPRRAGRQTEQRTRTGRQQLGGAPCRFGYDRDVERRGLRGAAAEGCQQGEVPPPGVAPAVARRAVLSQPSAPRSAPRLSSTSTWSMSGCPATRGTASGRTRSARRRGTSRRRSAETSGVVRTTSPRKLVCTTSSAGPRASCEAAGFIDQHDRDVVLDRILELAARAHEPVPRGGERDLALALRAGEDREQLLTDGHERPSSHSPVASIAAQIQLVVAPLRRGAARTRAP